jgi:hypothetical protein
MANDEGNVRCPLELDASLFPMKTNLRITILLIAVHITALPCLAQNDAATRYKVPPGGVRLHCGVVNLIEGEAEQLHGGETRPVKAKQTLETGDSISVSESGRIEILLTPGYYLRLSGNTRVTFLDLSAGNVKVKILTGSAIVEMALNELNPLAKRSVYDLVTISTPLDEYALTVGGAYRFNVHSDGSSDIRVVKGLAVVSGSSVKSGVGATVLRGRVATTSQDKQREDAFDGWSRERAGHLVQANKSLRREKWFKDLQDGKADAATEDPIQLRNVAEGRTVSARSGLVTLAEPGAVFKRGESEWENLKSGDALASGDRVLTPVDCRVDIRPLPDVGLMIAPETELSYRDTGEGEITLEINKGSVVVVPQFVGGSHSQSTITLVASSLRFEIARSGVYRVNVSPTQTEILVSEGGGRLAGREVKSSKKITVSSSGPSVGEFNKSAQDSFDVWADKRGGVYSVKYVPHVGGLPLELGPSGKADVDTGPVSGRNSDSPTGNGIPDPKQPKPPQ